MTYTQAEGTQLIIGLGATFQGGNTINKTFGKMNQTVWMLETLNEVIKEDCELNEDYAQIIKDKDRKIEELNIELEAINKIVDQKNENIQHFEFQISLIN